MRAPVLPVLSLALSDPIQPKVASTHQPEDTSVWKLVEHVQKHHTYKCPLFTLFCIIFQKNNNREEATFCSVSRIQLTVH